MQQLPLGVRIPDRAIFDSFFPGQNVEAVQHLRRLASGEARGLAWICGVAGAGKSHLLQAVCAAAAAGGRSGYFRLGELAHLGVGVLEGLQLLDCVCLDDVGATAGDPAWERALFALVCEIQDRDARLVLAAAAPPVLLSWKLADLRSRLAAAVIFQLRPLDETQQQQALQLRARLRGFELPEETSRWLQRRFPRDMRTLYELLDTLDEAALVAQRRLTVPFIRSVLEERSRSGE
jgi:DnaA-homolog protein